LYPCGWPSRSVLVLRRIKGFETIPSINGNTSGEGLKRL
jgi:hypothetical protein